MTAGMDSNAVVFNRISGEILSTLSGHSKRVCFTTSCCDARMYC